jgi:hypothetical protein
VSNNDRKGFRGPIETKMVPPPQCFGLFMSQSLFGAKIDRALVIFVAWYRVPDMVGSVVILETSSA